MAGRNPNKVLNGYITSLKSKAKQIDEFMATFRHAEALTDDDVEEGKELSKKLKDQFSRMEIDWDMELQKNCVEDADFEKCQALVRQYDESTAETVGKLSKFLKKMATPINPEGSVSMSATVQGAGRIDTTLKPPTLMRSNNLKEFVSWCEKFRAFFMQNREAMARLDIVVQRSHLFLYLEPELEDALRMHEKFKETTPIIEEGGCLDILKEVFMQDFPKHVRLHDFLQYKQHPGQSFKDWWVQKKQKAQQCELDKITEEDILLLVLMDGVADKKLQEEFLRQPEPKVKNLVAIASQWQMADGLMRQRSEFESRSRKTSNYKNGKLGKWRDERSRSSSSTKSSCTRCKDDSCQGGEECQALDKECHRCHGIGHFARACLAGRPTSPKGTSTTKRTYVKRASTPKRTYVRSMRVCPMDDNDATPVAKVTICPRGGGFPFKFRIIPDTGCTQSVIAADVVKSRKLRIDRHDKKKIFSASNGLMNCQGSVTFDVRYKGTETTVKALVSSTIHGECLLNWRSLQRLRIIPPDFPNHVSDVRKRPKTQARGLRSGGKPKQWQRAQEEASSPVLQPHLDQVPEQVITDHDARREEKMATEEDKRSRSSCPVVQGTWINVRNPIPGRRKSRGIEVDIDGKRYYCDRRFLRSYNGPRPQDTGRFANSKKLSSS